MRSWHEEGHHPSGVREASGCGAGRTPAETPEPRSTCLECLSLLCMMSPSLHRFLSGPDRGHFDSNPFWKIFLLFALAETRKLINSICFCVKPQLD